MNRLRIAVAGAGLIGRVHIHALQRSLTCGLCAIVDPSPAAAALAAEVGAPLFQSLTDLFAQLPQDRPDGVVLATPNGLHLSQAMACIDAGTPVLLEKPITPTVAEGEVLVRHAEARGARVLIGHHRAHSAVMAQASEVVRSGRLGRLVTVTGSATFYKPDAYFAAGPWRSQPGGGPILINMIHEVHNLRMLCGEIVAVQAMASNAVRGFAVEDTVSMNLRFASGTLGVFILSDTAVSARSWEQTSQENPIYATCADEDCYVLSGVRGSLAVPTLRLTAYPDPGERSWQRPFEFSRFERACNDPIQRQMEHFGAVIRGEAAPLVSARDGLNNLRVVQAITEAAVSGGVVEVSPPN